ncbi:hypothetical protein H0H87_008458, partial [Tephrocybe sp. NHM501043]
MDVIFLGSMDGSDSNVLPISGLATDLPDVIPASRVESTKKGALKRAWCLLPTYKYFGGHLMECLNHAAQLVTTSPALNPAAAAVRAMTT